jgi:hypothetical protein
MGGEAGSDSTCSIGLMAQQMISVSKHDLAGASAQQLLSIHNSQHTWIHRVLLYIVATQELHRSIHVG